MDIHGSSPQAPVVLRDADILRPSPQAPVVLRGADIPSPSPQAPVVLRDDTDQTYPDLRTPDGMPHGMTLAQMEAEARLSEMRVEALQQLTSALSGSRIYLPHAGHGTPQQLVWSSPTYGAGQQLMPGGLHAEVLHPGDSNNDGRTLVGRDHGHVELSASEQQPMTVGQESFHALARGPPDRSTIFAVKRDESRSPDSLPKWRRYLQNCT